MSDSLFNDNELYQEWYDKLLKIVSEDICKSCTDPQKDQFTINYENPLECGCRCQRVSLILEQTQSIIDDIRSN